MRGGHSREREREREERGEGARSCGEGDETDEEELTKRGCVVASVSPSVRLPLQDFGGSGPATTAEWSGLWGIRIEEGEDHVAGKAPAGDESSPPALSCRCLVPTRGDMYTLGMMPAALACPKLKMPVDPAPCGIECREGDMITERLLLCDDGENSSSIVGMKWCSSP